MKRFFVMCFSVLLVAFLSTSFTHTKSVVDTDVGYSLTIDQNLPIVTILPAESPVLIGKSESIQVVRGVSVPYKGLISQEIIVYNEVENFQCNTYYTIDRIDLKLPTLTGFEDQPDKYPFASDLGLRYS